ncbi:hypothetical protein HNR46_002955 [Haloferula luteola]|uniref:Uncharacterized protein n=1 Tax=Haloferula luteola TaxID=595692 RepID=A0A840V329_9BACT|nr:hypothetical protein [Haloferula luteola]MBB5352707.1 hypothetical protein [Haloferula luteola]
MNARLATLSLALITMPLMAQEGVAEQGLDFNQLRQLIEQSRKKPKVTPEQRQMAVLNELKIDRTPQGILAVRLEEAQGNEAAEEGEKSGATAEEGEAKVEPAESSEDDRALADFGNRANAYRRDVALGRWDQVKVFLGELPESMAMEAYQSLLEKLSSVLQVQPAPALALQGAKPYQQSAVMSPDDVLGLIAAAPKPPDKEAMAKVVKLLPTHPRPPQAFFDTLDSGISQFGGKDLADRNRAAEFLLDSGFVVEAGKFLPSLEASREKNDYAALNLIARYWVEWFRTDPSAAGKDAMPLAWEISTSFLSDSKAPTDAKAEALFRALSIIPELGDETGRKWLERTFADAQGEGVELLASLGSLTAQSQENPNEAVRLEQLKLQHAAVTTLLAGEQFDASEWSGIFALFAQQWEHEAEVTQLKDQSNSRRMVPRYDDWGNLFFERPDTGYQGSGARPIPAGQLLDYRPDERWLKAVDASTRDACMLATAHLLLKVKEENAALPWIKSIAATDPKQAKELVRELIRVWTQNHNPNEEQDYRSRYMYFYGFNNQSGSIPLTRSKQERNLVELAGLVKGIAALDLGESFYAELANAFISCHSQAEVWRVEAVDSVFGNTETLDSKTLAALVGKMRLNLAGLWPNPKLQQAYQTKRKDKELQEQILEGYVAAEAVLEKALTHDPEGAWRLEEQLAALQFEHSNYRSSLGPENQHAAEKRAALDHLGAAAASYVKTLPVEDLTQESSEPFETWFFAALGSPTLEALKSHHVATPAEFPKIKSALDALPGELGERHRKAFATTLNNRLANVAPDLKLRYLEAASEIAGGHEALRDADEVLAYYRDLITEIELRAEIDGSDRVGTDDPFGLRVDLRHTQEIEREAGGFQRYLQNQNNSPYAWNFGRPTEDYRDKFEKAARAVLEEHFEVVSLTFHSEKIESHTDAEFGWRRTPYAYFLLKPKGPQVDRVPPLKIDLDFNDTSGYVVLPIASSEVPIDAGEAEPRPFRDLKVVQTLDERSHAEKGSLYLEVKASAHGLVPDLEGLLGAMEGFEKGAIEDRGLRVVELDAAEEDLAPLSEHEWRIELKPQDGVLPASFHFPAVKAEVAKEDGLLRQRYVDVDLQPVGEEVMLGVSERQPVWAWIGGGLLAVVALGGTAMAKRRRRPEVEVVDQLPLPSRIHAVSVIGYLRRIQERGHLSATAKAEIEEEITSLEATHFGREESPSDREVLEAIARRWQLA